MLPRLTRRLRAGSVAAMHVAVTAVGTDRPGIVAAVTKVLYEHGANIEDSRMAILGGHFAMMLIVALPERVDPGRLESALGGPARDLSLVVTVRPVAEASPEHAAGAPYVVSVYGADHPGIVYPVTEALAARNVNITELATRVVEGATPVYVMLLGVTLPATLDPSLLEADFKVLGVRLGVDLSMHPAEADTL